MIGREQIRSILSLYHLEGLEAFGAIDDRPTKTVCWVRVGGRRYVLRLSARRRFSDMVFEKDLLRHLERRHLPVPRLVENVASGAFTPWEARGRYVSLFEALEGRAPAVFEVRARHARAVGEFLGRLHVESGRFRGQRGNDFDVEGLERSVARLQHALSKRRLPKRHAADVALLAEEIAEQLKRTPDGPRGIIHGGLDPQVVRFQDDQLAGVVDFETGCCERLVWDLAVAINGWCWEPTVRQQGGPAGAFRRRRLRALMTGYASERSLSEQELSELNADTRLAAARYAIERMIAHELRRTNSKTRRYQDYRHFTARLRSLKSKPLF